MVKTTRRYYWYRLTRALESRITGNSTNIPFFPAHRHHYWIYCTSAVYQNLLNSSRMPFQYPRRRQKLSRLSLNLSRKPREISITARFCPGCGVPDQSRLCIKFSHPLIQKFHADNLPTIIGTLNIYGSQPCFYRPWSRGTVHYDPLVAPQRPVTAFRNFVSIVRCQSVYVYAQI